MHKFPTLEELKSILHEMPKSKALGLDNIRVEILSRHWNVIKKGNLAVVLHFFNNHGILKSLNHTFLVLIPKSESASTLEYRQSLV